MLSLSIETSESCSMSSNELSAAIGIVRTVQSPGVLSAELVMATSGSAI